LNAGAVLFVQNVKHMRDFYRSVFAMNMEADETSYAVLTIPGFELVIHGIPSEVSTADSSPKPIVVQEESAIKLCLPVTSLEETRAIAKALGGFLKDKEHEWNFNGIVACDGHDPEGNVIQARQTPK
jgi:predicted enzyme related to lactoylglutathione lyase